MFRKVRNVTPLKTKIVNSVYFEEDFYFDENDQGFYACNDGGYFHDATPVAGDMSLKRMNQLSGGDLALPLEEYDTDEYV